MNIKTAAVFAIIFAWLLWFFLALSDAYMDDAYIGFTYIRNLVEGNGFVFNIGQRVEGVTNAGWLLFLTPACFFLPIPATAKVIALVLLIISAILLYQTRHFFFAEDSDFRMLLVLFCSLSSFDLLYFSFTGMETAFTAFVILLAFLLTIRGRYNLTAILLAMAFTVRPETVTILPLWALIAVVARCIDLKTFFKLFLVFLGSFFFIEILRFSYYGSWLPNTFFAKPSSSGIFLQNLFALARCDGSLRNISFPFSNLIAPLFVFAGAYSGFRHNRTLGLLVFSAATTGYAFSIYAKEDWTMTGRYFAPYTFAAFLMIFAGFSEAFARLSLPIRRQRLILFGLSMIVAFVGILNAWFWLKPESQKTYPWYVMNSRPLEDASRWIEKNTPADSVIATRRIGCLSYFSRRRVFDYKFGLPEPEVAALIKTSKEPFNTPQNPLLKEIWQKADPDYILEDTGLIHSFGYKQHRGNFEVHGRIYSPVQEFKINENTNWVLCRKK
ncbi:MAG: hypothetical protein ACOYXC_15940 [Candidatus Rifleibacteriota bacterium]